MKRLLLAVLALLPTGVAAQQLPPGLYFGRTWCYRFVLHSDDAPRIGTTMTIYAYYPSQYQASSVFVLTASTRQQTVPLAPLGIPCVLEVEPQVSFPPITPQSQYWARWVLAVPNDPALVYWATHMQAIMVAPINAAGIAVSSRMTVALGF